jgi:ubiquitin carboxyl-terminal hydrolase 34
LLLSDRLDYNPSDFCFSFKDYTGMPVDLNVQQDAQEFLNILFDQIETSIKNTPFRTLL